MNLSRAYTLAYGEELSVGPRPDADAGHARRARACDPQLRAGRLPGGRRHLPPGWRDRRAHYQGTWFRPQPEGGGDKETLQKAMRLPAGRRRGRTHRRARAHRHRAIESIESETQRMAPPPLYDLTELQRHANRLFGFSAQRRSIWRRRSTNGTS